MIFTCLGQQTIPRFERNLSRPYPIHHKQRTRQWYATRGDPLDLPWQAKEPGCCLEQRPTMNTGFERSWSRNDSPLTGRTKRTGRGCRRHVQRDSP